MLQGGMSDLMPHHCRQPSVVLGDWQYAGIDTDLSARQTKGIGLLAFENHELPLRAGQIDNRGDTFADAPDQLVGLRILADGHLFLHLVETVYAELGYFTF